MAKAYEVNFDGIVGPTHNYSGLSLGNVASTSHKDMTSNPLEAVLQGLAKMKNLADLGFKQGVLPPQERPDIEALKNLGFSGSEKKVLSDAAKTAPELLSAVGSASSMWTANSCTISPSFDTADKHVHFTTANLITKFHRSIEAKTTAIILKKTFKNPKYFTHHSPLPGNPSMGDEGAANHTRLCADYGKKGLEFFVYGRGGLSGVGPGPKKFPARQTREACEALARIHGLNPKAVVFAQQNPEAIDAGVFHNDVAGVGNQNVYFYHQQAYVNSSQVMDELQKKFQETCGAGLHLIEVPSKSVSLGEAVKSYLFNSQLLTLEPGHMILVAPMECQETPNVAQYLERLLRDKNHPIREVRYFDLRQSMFNGGGPACLRLRVALGEKELGAVNKKSLMNDKLYDQLVPWAKKYYRDRLSFKDLQDPQLLNESRRALDKLTQILGLGSIYPFQL